MRRYLPFLFAVLVIGGAFWFALRKPPAPVTPPPPPPIAVEVPNEKILLPVLVEFTIEHVHPAAALGPVQVVPSQRIDAFTERLKATGWKETKISHSRYQYSRPIGGDTRGFRNPARVGIGRPKVAANH